MGSEMCIRDRDKGEYGSLATADKRNLAAAKSGIVRFGGIY